MNFREEKQFLYLHPKNVLQKEEFNQLSATQCIDQHGNNIGTTIDLAGNEHQCIID